MSGPIVIQASKRPLKVTRQKIQERSIQKWTPVLIWPTGFEIKYERELLKYSSGTLLHHDKWPIMPRGLTGGVIIDLKNEQV